MPTLTVQNVIDLYLTDYRDRGGPEFQRDRRRTLDLFADAYGALAAADCQPEMLTTFVDNHPEWRSNATRGAKAFHVRTAFRYAALKDKIDRNPFRDVGFPQAERRGAMPDETYSQLLRRAHPLMARAMRFLRLTGLRLGVFRRLTWPMVDLDAGALIIDRPPRSPWVAALTIDAVRLLWEIRIEQPPEYQGHVFLNAEGRPWARTTLGENLRRLKRRCGIDTRTTLHGLRNALASNSIAHGADLALVATQLGYSCTAAMRRTDARLSTNTDEIRRAIAKGEPAPEGSQP